MASRRPGSNRRLLESTECPHTSHAPPLVPVWHRDDAPAGDDNQQTIPTGQEDMAMTAIALALVIFRCGGNHG